MNGRIDQVAHSQLQLLNTNRKRESQSMADNEAKRGHGGKKEDKVPAAASAASATLVKIPKKKGRKVKPKGMFQ